MPGYGKSSCGCNVRKKKCSCLHKKTNARVPNGKRYTHQITFKNGRDNEIKQFGRYHNALHVYF